VITNHEYIFYSEKTAYFDELKQCKDICCHNLFGHIIYYSSLSNDYHKMNAL